MPLSIRRDIIDISVVLHARSSGVGGAADAAGTRPPADDPSAGADQQGIHAARTVAQLAHHGPPLQQRRLVDRVRGTSNRTKVIPLKKKITLEILRKIWQRISDAYHIPFFFCCCYCCLIFFNNLQYFESV